MNWRRPPYSERYPALADLAPYLAKRDGVPPENNVVARNICAGGKWLHIHWNATEAMLKLGDNLVADQPGFANFSLGQQEAQAADFALRPDSPAWKMGFEAIPLERIAARAPGRARR
jgi:hypothetical protein